MWRWIIAAPDASQRLAVSTSSSRVVGSAGQSAFAVSAPVGATVIRVDAMNESCQIRLRNGYLPVMRPNDRTISREAGYGLMRAVVQRVSRASVTVEGEVVGAI